MKMNILTNIAVAGRRIALLAAALTIFGAPALIPAYARPAQEQQDKQQEKAEKRQQKSAEKEVKKAHRQRGNAQEIMRYERAHYKKYSPHAGERVVRDPDREFEAHFGREHRFHMARPTMVEGFPRFEYQGFSFVVEEPWPEYWYDDDDFYIVHERGTYYVRNYDDLGVEVQVVLVKSVF